MSLRGPFRMEGTHPSSDTILPCMSQLEKRLGPLYEAKASLEDEVESLKGKLEETSTSKVISGSRAKQDLSSHMCVFSRILGCRIAG